MKKKSFLALLLILVMTISCACGSKDGDSTTTDDTEENTTSESGSEAQLNADLFTDRDFEVGYDESTSAIITLNGDSAQCSSNAVEISGTTVTIKDEGTYILRGTLNDGMIIVNANKKDKPQIVLDNVTINSDTSAPIYILQADKVFITMAANSENTLSNGGTFTAIDDNNIDSVIFSKDDLTLNGNGTLTITSPAGHGIVSKDELTITSGTYAITSASHGIAGKDNVCITNAIFQIAAGKDGIHAENSDDSTLGFAYIQSGTFDISAEGDGIAASANMKIEDGTFAIVTGGGSENAAKQTSEDWGNFGGGNPMGGGMGGGRGRDHGMGGGTQGGSMMNTSADTGTQEVTDMDSSEDSTSIKGIKASTNLTINGGTFNIDSADDAVHANGNVTVNGGTFEIATGDDGFHADETLTVTAGNINITESYEGLEGLHVNVSGGNISLVASDDGFNAAGGTDSSGTGGMRGGDNFGGGGMGGDPGSMGGSSNGTIVISGGNININASGDGLDANGTLEISGGTTVVSGPFNGDTATLDYDTSGVITGGTFIGTGASGMAQTFSDSEQGVIAVNAGSQNAVTKITLTDKEGNVILEHEAILSFSVVILSSPDIVTGETYTITVGTASGEFEAS